jgi:hypothetical protein
MYILVTHPLTKEQSVVKNGLGIPFDPDNTDYQEYLAWLAEGNEPLPADSE